MHPICVQCHVEMKIKTIGVEVTEMICVYPPQPYKIWNADLFQCPICKVEVIASFGNRPCAESFQDDFESKVVFAKSNPKHVPIYEITAIEILSPDYVSALSPTDPMLGDPNEI